MITKGECKEALKTIISRGGDYEDLLYWTCAMPEAINTLNNLIDEHFDNQPLKFEELKEGMFVYDKSIKSWIGIYKTRDEIDQYVYCWKNDWPYAMGFLYEPNRFYRKEVQE